MIIKLIDLLMPLKDKKMRTNYTNSWMQEYFHARTFRPQLRTSFISEKWIFFRNIYALMLTRKHETKRNEHKKIMKSTYASYCLLETCPSALISKIASLQLKSNDIFDFSIE